MLKGVAALMRSVALLVIALLVSAIGTRFNPANDDCTLQEIHTPIAQHMIVPYGGTTASVRCLANATLRKCEGSCESKVLPSVVSHSGYRQFCRCCRETGYEFQEVSCIINEPDLPRFERTLTVKFITGCACHECVD